MEYGTGRIVHRDTRDEQFLMRSLLPATTTRTSRYWYDSSVFLDQGATGTCVGHGWAHWLADSPRTNPGIIEQDALSLYREATLLDPWPENDADSYDFGTTVRAGAKAITARGRMSEYRWAWDLDTVILHLLERGPVVLGTDWYNSMFYPRRIRDAAGTTRVTIPVDTDSGLAGGHCYILNGINVPGRVVRMKNSWGHEWGANGRANISFDDLAFLISSNGEACAAVEAA